MAFLFGISLLNVERQKKMFKLDHDSWKNYKENEGLKWRYAEKMITADVWKLFFIIER